MRGLPGNNTKRSNSTLALVTACALGFACGGLASRKSGNTLPEAGSARDDGSGLLAAVSMGPTMGAPKKKTATGGNNYAYKSDYSYGTNGYGGTRYGGSIYSNYQFLPDSTARYVPLPSQYDLGYSVQTIENGGAIEGTVSWPKAPRAKPIPKLSKNCREDARDTLRIEGGKVGGAVVYLEDIKKGRAHPANGNNRKLQLGGLVVRDACSLSPRVQVMSPIGGSLTLRTTVSGRHVTRVNRFAKPDLEKSESEHKLESLSAGADSEHRLDSSGFYSVVAQGQSDSSGAWVVVAGHPYYTVTDSRGSFSLETVPPGTYTLVVWHPSVFLGDGKWTEPKLSRRKVVVKAYQTTRASVALK